MTDFEAVLAAALQLPKQDRLRLISALWNTVLPESEAPFSDEWVREIDHRLAEFEAGRVKTIPWSQVRDEALGRIE